MIVSHVEVAGFRGFRERTRLDFPEGFAVLTGRNGAGKSTIIDAFDFVLTGSITKYAVKGAKGGGLRDHIWWVGEGEAPDHYVTVGFREDSSEPITLTRYRDGTISPALDEVAHRLCSVSSPSSDWNELLVQTSLLRDETIAALSLDLPEQARFAAVKSAIAGMGGKDHSKRTSRVLNAAASEKQNQEQKLTRLREELGRRLASLTESRSAADQQGDVAEAEGVISELAPGFPPERAERLDDLRRYVARLKVVARKLRTLADSAEAISKEMEEVETGGVALEREKSRHRRDAAERAVRKAESEVENQRQHASTERLTDEFASHFVSLLEHGEAVGLQDGHCPLCRAARSEREFKEAIAAAEERLEGHAARVHAANARLRQAEETLASATKALVESQHELDAHEARRTAIVRRAEYLRSEIEEVSPEGTLDAASLRDAALARQDSVGRLEYALALLETSSAHAEVVRLQHSIEDLRKKIAEQTERVSDAERAVDAAKQIDRAAQSIPNQVLAEKFDTVMPLLKELYRRLRPHADWSEIDTDFGGKVRASLNLTVGSGHKPQFLFSSGQRRAAGVAFLLSILLSRPWSRLQTVFLDDPVQHIDDYRALNLVEVLSAVRRGGRQIVVTAEDPALADLLSRRLRSTAAQSGRRFDLGMNADGSAGIRRQVDIPPLTRHVLHEVSA